MSECLPRSGSLEQAKTALTIQKLQLTAEIMMKSFSGISAAYLKSISAHTLKKNKKKTQCMTPCRPAAMVVYLLLD